MSSQYKCTLCSKEFKQKIDYTRHKNKKNACITADQLQQVVEQKINHDTTVKNMSTLFSGCMNILRDNESLTGDKALRNLSYLLVLRLIEPMIGGEIDLESMDYPFPDVYRPKKDKFLKYTKFSNIAASKEDDIPTILGLIWDFILSNHPKTQDIFLRGKGFDMKKQATFRKLIDKLSEFDFSGVDVDIQGHAYEDLLKDIMTGKVLGQFFTQPLVKDMMVDLINPQLLDDGTCETIFDPAMGTGGFLMTSLRHLQKQAEMKKQADIDKESDSKRREEISESQYIDWNFISSRGVGGRETEPDTFQLCKTNMLVSCGHMLDNLQQGDSIRDPIRGKYDIVLANPPFGIKGLEYQEIKNHDGIRDKYLPIESKSAVPLFLQAIISILKIGGRCAMVMPDGQELFGKGKALVALREYLMKTCELREVIYLPSGVFSNTSIKTCVLYFYKRKEGSDVVEIGGKKTRTYKFSRALQTEKVQFYDYNPYEKVKNLLIEVDASIIAENNYSLNYAEYLQTEENADQDEKDHNSEVEWKTLGEVFKFENGKNKASECDDSGEYSFITNADDKTHSSYTIDGENLFICRINASKVVFKTKIKYYSGKCSFSSLMSRFIPLIEGIFPKFYYYYFNSIISEIERFNKGVANKTLDIDLLSSKLKIPLPSLQSQQKIVERLDYLYETCTETSRSLIEQFRTKKAMIVEMGTEGVQTKPLGEVCEIDKNLKKHPTSHGNSEGKYKFHTGGVRTDLYVDTPDYKEYYIIQNRTNGSGKCNLFLDNNFSLATQTIAYKAINGDITTKYIYYYLQNNIVTLEQGYVGANHKNISKEYVSNIQIPIPSLQSQQRIVQECERLDKLITDLEADIEADKTLASEFLNKAIKGPETEPEEEYTQIIISDEEYDPDAEIVISE